MVSIAKLKSLKDVEGLIKKLGDTDDYVRRKAAWVLGEIGDIRAYSYLEEVATRDPDYEVREIANRASSKIIESYKSYINREHKKPELHIKIVADAGLKVGMWEQLHTIVINAGKSGAKDVRINLSGPAEIKAPRTIPKLRSGEKEEILIGIKPTEHGNLPLDVSVSYTDEYSIVPFEIKDVAYINVAKETETISLQPRSIFNIGSIGEVLGVGAIKTGDIGMVKGGIGSTEKPFRKCPYCGEELNLPKTPKYCPYCGEQLK